MVDMGDIELIAGSPEGVKILVKEVPLSKLQARVKELSGIDVIVPARLASMRVTAGIEAADWTMALRKLFHDYDTVAGWDPNGQLKWILLVGHRKSRSELPARLKTELGPVSHWLLSIARASHGIFDQNRGMPGSRADLVKIDATRDAHSGLAVGRDLMVVDPASPGYDHLGQDEADFMVNPPGYHHRGREEAEFMAVDPAAPGYDREEAEFMAVDPAAPRYDREEAEFMAVDLAAPRYDREEAEFMAVN